MCRIKCYGSIRQVLVLFSFGIIGVILLYIYRQTTIPPNAWGYIESGGDCQAFCAGHTDSCIYGPVNVSFYFIDGMAYHEIEGQWALTTAPSICTYESGKCCQNLIENRVLLHMQVDIIDQNFWISQITLDGNKDSFYYLLFGLMSLIMSLLTVFGIMINNGWFKIHHLSRSPTPNSFN